MYVGVHWIKCASIPFELRKVTICTTNILKFCMALDIADYQKLGEETHNMSQIAKSKYQKMYNPKLATVFKKQVNQKVL